MLQTVKGGNDSFGRYVMLHIVQGGKGSLGRDVILQTVQGVFRERRDVTVRGKRVGGERRDVTDNARGKMVGEETGDVRMCKAESSRFLET